MSDDIPTQTAERALLLALDPILPNGYVEGQPTFTGGEFHRLSEFVNDFGWDFALAEWPEVERLLAAALAAPQAASDVADAVRKLRGRARHAVAASDALPGDRAENARIHERAATYEEVIEILDLAVSLPSAAPDEAVTLPQPAEHFGHEPGEWWYGCTLCSGLPDGPLRAAADIGSVQLRCDRCGETWQLQPNVNHTLNHVCRQSASSSLPVDAADSGLRERTDSGRAERILRLLAEHVVCVGEGRLGDSDGYRETPLLDPEDMAYFRSLAAAGGEG